MTTIPGPASRELRCPSCQSPAPGLHPAVSGGGEVTRICPDPWHTPVPPATVTVRLDDLVTVLEEAEGFIGGKDNPAFTRLAEAAGVS